MKHPTSRALYDYWNALRGKRSSPQRAEIEPHALKDILSEVFILEREDALTYRFRLAGTDICALYGQELRSRNLLDYWSREQRESIESLLYSVTEDAAAAVLGVDAEIEAGESVGLELLLLPLRTEDAKITRVLGSAALVARPSWFGLEPVVKQSVKSLRLIWPDHAPRFLAEPQSSQPVFEPPFADNMPARRTNGLRVIEGGLGK